MSIVMVGPFPGPFDRSHYSDSSSGNPTDAQPRPPRAQGLGQRPPRPPGPYLSVLQEQETPRTSGTPRDNVAYSAVRTDYGAPPPVCVPTRSREPRHESLPEPPRPLRGVAFLKRKCYVLLCRLALAGLCLIAVALLVVVASRSMRVRADAAPVKAGNAAVRPDNGTDRKGSSTALRATSPTHASAPAAAVGGPRARSTVRPPAEARHYKHRHGAVTLKSSQVASVASTSPAAVFSGVKAAANDKGNDSGPQGVVVASPDPAASKASTLPGKITEAGSVAVATTTASTDLPEVINEADDHGDLQEV
ncbi:hypothetical protein MTO96_018837 [Rhipicephalus appendiculatus]